MKPKEVKEVLTIGADPDDLAGAKTLQTLADSALESLPQDPQGFVQGKKDRIAAVSAAMTLAAQARMAREKSTRETPED